MGTVWIVLFVLVVGGALVALVCWRIWGSRGKKPVLVAKANHKSLRSFHYGPAPEALVAAPTAAPELPADSMLLQLLPEEDFKARQEQEIQAEADRNEAEEIAQREPLTEPAAVETAVESAAPVEAEEPVPVLLSSRHAPGATVNVFDVLALVGNDAPASASIEAPEPAPVTAAEEAAVAAPQPVAATEPPDDEPVGDAIYDNPVSPTRAASTKNDAANTQASVMLRQRNRLALQARLDAQKMAMSAFTTEKKQLR